MNEKDNFALVPRAPSSLERAEPGAKRILSGMVADTLALVKKELPSKRDVHVLMAGSLEFQECFSFCVSQADDRLKAHFDFHFHSCQRMDELAAALKQGSFDLALVQLHNSPPVEHQFADKREVLLRVESLFAENAWLVWAGLEVASFLHSVHGIPVIMVSDTGDEEAEKLLAAQVGARALFPWLQMDIQAFCECLRGILQDADKPTKTRPFRIVHVDDEGWMLEMVSLMIHAKFRNVVIDTFQNGDKAWEELLRADPDLLITDLFNNNIPGRTQSFARLNFGMNGYELLPLLAQKKAKYPVLVLSASLSSEGYERRARQDAGPNLNVSFLKKPVTLEQLYEELSKHLDSRVQLRSGKP